MAYDTIQHTQNVASLLAAETPFVVITLLEIRGSAPQIVGAKAIVSAGGIESGTIGGGKIEAAAIDFARTQLASESGADVELRRWNLQNDIGMTCGGEIYLLFEVHRFHNWPIAVFGAGHIAQTLVPLLTQLNCHVTCIDPRQDWIDKLDDHPKLTKRCVSDPASAVRDLPRETYFVLMSKGHATDLPVLAAVLGSREAPYVGVIGSKQKASVLRRDLASLEIDEQKIASFFCPMGLPIGNNTPTEIAISVAGQLISVRDSRA